MVHCLCTAVIEAWIHKNDIALAVYLIADSQQCSMNLLIEQ